MFVHLSNNLLGAALNFFALSRFILFLLNFRRKAVRHASAGLLFAYFGGASFQVGSWKIMAVVASPDMQMIEGKLYMGDTRPQDQETKRSERLKRLVREKQESWVERSSLR